MAERRNGEDEDPGGNDPEMQTYVEGVLSDLWAASFLLDLAEKLEALGHPGDATECRGIARRLQRVDGDD